MRCFYYWLLNPPPQRIFEKGREAALEITIRNRQRSCRLGFFLNERNQPQFVRLIIPDVANDSSLENLLPFLQDVKEHALTTLRLGYDSNVSFFRLAVWGFYPDDGAPSADVEMEAGGEPVFEPENLRNLYVHSFPLRHQFRLMSNGMNQAIPPQYRFLSLYKLLEMQFRRRGEWSEAKLQKYLLPLAPEFAQRGFKETPLQLLHELRDKCAHVRTGRRREVLGVSELNHRQLVRVLKMLPILGKACAAVLHDASSGQVTITTVDENDNWQ